MLDGGRMMYLFSLLGRSKDYWANLDESEWFDDHFFNSGLTFEDFARIIKDEDKLSKVAIAHEKLNTLINDEIGKSFSMISSTFFSYHASWLEVWDMNKLTQLIMFSENLDDNVIEELNSVMRIIEFEDYSQELGQKDHKMTFDEIFYDFIHEYSSWRKSDEFARLRETALDMIRELELFG